MEYKKSPFLACVLGLYIMLHHEMLTSRKSCNHTPISNWINNPVLPPPPPHIVHLLCERLLKRVKKILTPFSSGDSS